MQLKLSPFSFSILSFLGFAKEEMQHMEEVAVVNGMYLICLLLLAS